MDKLPWPTLATTTAMATTSLIVLARIALWPRKQAVLKSPLRTVMPRLSSEELAGLAYVPDSFPGARDVDTPVWGTEAKNKLSTN